MSTRKKFGVWCSWPRECQAVASELYGGAGWVHGMFFGQKTARARFDTLREAKNAARKCKRVVNPICRYSARELPR